MDEICESVPSQKGAGKLCVRGYLMVKDKCVGNIYYWCCERKKSLCCKGRAISKLSDGHHYLAKFVEHNHSPWLSAASISMIMDGVKKQARETRDLPCQIIQSCTTSAPLHVAAVLPSNEAIWQRIKRARSAQRPVEPKTLADINVPMDLRVTSGGEMFLIKDKRVGENGFLMFTTKADVQKLAVSSFWIMDGTFKTVPKVFYQFYTIHAPVVHGSLRTFPLVYVVMTGKSRAIYESVFEELVAFSEENELSLNPAI
uniref:FLYWCH-type domain-containing protein n=1 Tax=Trichuris muris TaxID=70415 RepID=A0A5S6QN60_TRIMR